MLKGSKRILAFLLITFGLMYLSHGLIYFVLEATTIEWDSFPLNLLGIIGGGAPAFAALFLVYRMYSEKEQKAYWDSVYLLKVPWIWWVVSLISPVLIGMAANIVYHGGWWYPNVSLEDIMAFPLALFVMVFAGGVEELGWRGILQNALSKRVNLVVTGLVIGVVWGIWHGPLFVIEVFAHYDYAFLTYMVFTIMYSLLLTLLVYKTKSVLLAIIMHASINASGTLGLGLPMEVHGAVLVLLLVLSIAFAVLIWFAELQDKVKTPNLLHDSQRHDQRFRDSPLL